ncbi:MAG TPA: glucose 1-dehydrogenase [Gemmatimonadaceae bacterium]|jgi:NAD(P)-dependent dehydrogenase (short-subunit alcohol dehydrogenase family)|nr:glucose 1-dehydrogenase [Gemmatimonadaceae bacterium]
MMQGKVALVTGGSSGIGLATAHLFARQGASVVIAARNPQRGAAALYALRAAGADAEFVQTDVSLNDEVSALMRAVIERYDRLDFAVNSAATDEVGMGLTADLSEADFDSAIALNLKSVWLCMKYEIKRMLEQREGGSIVNVSSVNGLGGVPGAGTYAVAKAGVIALAKSAAMEYAARRIRVNALVAGAYDTPLLRRAVERYAKGDTSAYTSRIPLGRIGNPEEAAEAAVWLCSEASSYVTGNAMIVDGGMTSWAR